MQIDHIAIWTNDLEQLKHFYVSAFGCNVSEKYENKVKKFSSYFLCFEGGTGIELMSRADVTETHGLEHIGLAHLAFRLESMEQVDTMTKEMEEAGIPIYSYPRITGDGYYESVILDVDNNKIELVAIPPGKISCHQNMP